MTHDPLCPNGEMTWLPSQSICLYCHVIDRVRKDQTQQCITAVEALPTTIQIPVAHPHEGCPDPTVHMRWTPFLAVPDILAAMRALSANADSDRNVSERRQEKP